MPPRLLRSAVTTMLALRFLGYGRKRPPDSIRLKSQPPLLNGGPIMWPSSTYHPLLRLRTRTFPGLLLRQHALTAALPPRDTGADTRGGRVEITVELSPGTTTVFIRGQLDLVTMPLLAEHLTTVLAVRPRRLVIDLTRTGFLDCGSARLIATASQSLPPGQRVVLRRPAPGVRRVFELTGLDANCDMEG